MALHVARFKGQSRVAHGNLPCLSRVSPARGSWLALRRPLGNHICKRTCAPPPSRAPASSLSVITCQFSAVANSSHSR